MNIANHIQGFSPSHRAEMLSVIGGSVVEVAEKEIIELQKELEHINDRINQRHSLIRFVNEQKSHGGQKAPPPYVV